MWSCFYSHSYAILLLRMDGLQFSELLGELGPLVLCLFLLSFVFASKVCL